MRAILAIGLVFATGVADAQAVSKSESYITDKQRAAALKADTKTAVIDAVKAQLKDPDSAKFRGIKREGPFAYCGWVNAKNSYGGYEGYSVFFATDKATVIISPDLSEPQLCD